MNDTSSRSHAIFTLNFTQVRQKLFINSMINFSFAAKNTIARTCERASFIFQSLESRSARLFQQSCLGAWGKSIQ